MIIIADMIDNEQDKSRFDRIYREYKDTMYYTAYDVLNNVFDAEDVVAISMIKVINLIGKIQDEEIGTDQFQNLMITIAKNTAIDVYRKKNRSASPMDTEEIYGEDEPAGASAEEIYIEAEQYQEIMNCINELSDRMRDVLRLRLVFQLSARETAQILNMKEGSIGSCLARAKRKLAKLLKERRQK